MALSPPGRSERCARVATARQQPYTPSAHKDPFPRALATRISHDSSSPPSMLARSPVGPFAFAALRFTDYKNPVLSVWSTFSLPLLQKPVRQGQAPRVQQQKALTVAGAGATLPVRLPLRRRRSMQQTWPSSPPTPTEPSAPTPRSPSASAGATIERIQS